MTLMQPCVPPGCVTSACQYVVFYLSSVVVVRAARSHIRPFSVLPLALRFVHQWTPTVDFNLRGAVSAVTGIYLFCLLLNIVPFVRRSFLT